MEKQKLKTESSYAINLKVDGHFENIRIIQEENIPDRNAIRVEFMQERWRSVENTVELLEKIVIVLKKSFLPTN